MEFKRPDLKLIKEFESFSTPTISDALDKLGVPGGCHGIMPVVSGVKMAGTAYTIRYVPVGAVRGTVGDYIDDVLPGDVVVLDNKGRTDCTVWGDILTITAKMKGIAGTVIDGVCRDIPTILKEKYPVFSCGRFMMTGKERVMVEATQVMVSIGKTQVKPGDIIIGDDSGVVVVPREMALKVLEIARAIEEAENFIVKAVQKGLSLKKAREKFGYHTLQTKKT
ncbi:MAG: RraA family protein [Proteobacteria bacterium]|nr:RraA family protein [Pseudomonadota bacterium]